MSNLKGAFIIAILFFIAKLSFVLVSCLHLSRHVPIENKSPHGVESINQFNVSHRYEHALISLPINNPLDFLFLSTTDDNECFGTTVLKLTMCVVAGIFILQFNENDPFNVRVPYLIQIFSTLMVALFFCESIKTFYTAQVISEMPVFKTQSSDSQWEYNKQGPSYILLTMQFAVMGFLLSAYIKAVKNKRELDLTI